MLSCCSFNIDHTAVYHTLTYSVVSYTNIQRCIIHAPDHISVPALMYHMHVYHNLHQYIILRCITYHGIIHHHITQHGMIHTTIAYFIASQTTVIHHCIIHHCCSPLHRAQQSNTTGSYMTIYHTSHYYITISYTTYLHISLYHTLIYLLTSCIAVILVLIVRPSHIRQ